MARLSLNQRVQWLPLIVTAVCTAALALLLFTGVQLAARLQSASSALQLASGLTAQPQLLRSELTLIQRGLETQTYVGDSLHSLAIGRAASNRAYARLAAAMRRGATGHALRHRCAVRAGHGALAAARQRARQAGESQARRISTPIRPAARR